MCVLVGGGGGWETEKESQNLSFCKKYFFYLLLAVLGLGSCADFPLVVASGERAVTSSCMQHRLSGLQVSAVAPGSGAQAE